MRVQYMSECTYGFNVCTKRFLLKTTAYDESSDIILLMYSRGSRCTVQSIVTSESRRPILSPFSHSCRTKTLKLTSILNLNKKREGKFRSENIQRKYYKKINYTKANCLYEQDIFVVSYLCECCFVFYQTQTALQRNMHDKTLKSYILCRLKNFS